MNEDATDDTHYSARPYIITIEKHDPDHGWFTVTAPFDTFSKENPKREMMQQIADRHYETPGRYRAFLWLNFYNNEDEDDDDEGTTDTHSPNEKINCLITHEPRPDLDNDAYTARLEWKPQDTLDDSPSTNIPWHAHLSE